MELKPIQILPARERVASALRKAIISRSIPAGEQITLDMIAGLLGVSKTPVREAFMMLENEALIETLPNKRVVVCGVTEKTVREHFQIRAALESEAAAFCCREGVDISPIVSVVNDSRRLMQNKEYEKYSGENQAFHLAIWTASGNERLKNMLSVMWNGLSMRYMETLESYAAKSFEEHEQILKALQARDKALAQQLMHAHIDRSMHDMLTNLMKDSSEKSLNAESFG